MNRYIFSLTSIPSRFNNIELIIDSLINQSLKPEKIILNLPKKYNIRFNEYICNDKINQLKTKYLTNNLIINIIDKDYGPGTKLLGLFHNNIIDLNDENTFIVLVDDDLIYKPIMLEYFDTYVKNNKNVKVASFCIALRNGITIGQGADGFYIKSNLLNKFYEYFEKIKEFKYILYHDDYYISYYFYLKNIEIIHLRGKTPLSPNGENNLVYSKYFMNSNNNSLFSLSGDLNRINLNKQIYNILCKLRKDGIFNFIY